MGNILFNCPHCGKSLQVEGEGAGLTVPCPECNQELVIPSPNPARPLPQQKIVGQSIEKLSERVEKGVDDVIKKFVGEQQDPAQAQTIYSKVSQILTKEERIEYIAIQNKPLVNIAPDALVLTNRRFIVYHLKVLGRVNFEDYIWRELLDVKLSEGILTATVKFVTGRGTTVSLDYIPKPQARKLYAYAQEMEERVREERRLREMEEKRAASGGVYIQGGAPGTQASSPQPQEDPVQKLKQLKDMQDAGLITAGEYEAKRQAILSRM